jgi:hypothetical protein
MLLRNTPPHDILSDLTVSEYRRYQRCFDSTCSVVSLLHMLLFGPIILNALLRYDSILVSLFYKSTNHTKKIVTYCQPTTIN